MTERALIALGSNLGDRRAALAGARALLTCESALRLLAVTRVEETAPIGTSAQGAYLNQMVAVRTTLSPHALLAVLHRIEDRMGRVRRVRWGPRVIDLDLVEYGALVINTPALCLPHPGVPSRGFWMRELHELQHVA